MRWRGPESNWRHHDFQSRNSRPWFGRGCRDFPERADVGLAFGFLRIPVDLGHERPVMTKRCAVFLLNRDRWFARAGLLSAAVPGFDERSRACAPTRGLRKCPNHAIAGASVHAAPAAPPRPSRKSRRRRRGFWSGSRGGLSVRSRLRSHRHEWGRLAAATARALGRRVQRAPGQQPWLLLARAKR